MYLSLERKRIEQIRKRDQSISIEAEARMWKIDTSKQFLDYCGLGTHNGIETNNQRLNSSLRNVEKWILKCIRV